MIGWLKHCAFDGIFTHDLILYFFDIFSIYLPYHNWCRIMSAVLLQGHRDSIHPRSYANVMGTGQWIELRCDSSPSTALKVDYGS